MKTTVTHVSDTRVELTISLGQKELDAAEQVALTKLSRDLKAPGFRKGKAPIAVVRKHIDPAKLSEQTLDDALSKAVAEAFTSENIRALERPQVDIKKLVPGQLLEFTAECDVLPTVKLGSYTKLKSKPAKVSVSDEEVDDLIERMRSGFAEKKEVKRPAQDGDETVIDFLGKKDGVAFEGGKGDDYTLTLGSHQFIPGFEEGVIGHKTGETFDLELTFPADYHAKDLAGAKVVFTTTLKEVKEVVLPEVNDEFAAKCGPFTTVDELRADIRKELHAQKEREAGEKHKDELVGELVGSSSVPVPAVLVQDQARSIEQDMTQNLMYRGVTLDQYVEQQKFKDQDEWREKEVRPAAEKRVKAGLVLAELSKELKIEATSEELAAHIDMYRSQYGNNPEVLKQFDNPEVQRDIANRLLTEKTVDKLVELNTAKAKK